MGSGPKIRRSSPAVPASASPRLMPYSPRNATPEQPVSRGFVSGRQRPGMDESCYVVPSATVIGGEVPAIRIEIVTGYVSPRAVDDIKDYIEWRMGQEATRETVQPPQPARPQLVP